MACCTCICNVQEISISNLLLRLWHFAIKSNIFIECTTLSTLAFSQGFSCVWLRALISARFSYSEFASLCRAQLDFSFFLFLSKTPWRWEVKSRKFQLVPLTTGVEIAKILSSSIDDSLSVWIGLLDGTRIRTLVNLLYLGIRDNHWNYVNFETLETGQCKTQTADCRLQTADQG